MDKIDKNLFEMINSLTELSGCCNLFNKTANVENGEKILEKIEKCEEKFLQIKENVVELVQAKEKAEHYIEAIKINSGFLVSGDSNE